MKKLSAFSIILLLLMLFVQFTLAFSTFNGEGLNAYDTYFKFQHLHWSFNYFIFIIVVIIVGILLEIIHNFEKHKFTYWFDFTFWTIGCWGQVVIGWQLQDFLKANPTLGIKDESYTLALSVFPAMLIWIFSLLKVVVEYMEKADKDMPKFISKGYKNYLKDKSDFYETTILLNPKWSDPITHPYPYKMAITKDEIIISTDPPTIITYKSISAVKMDGRLTFSIHRLDGKIYRIMWGSPYKHIAYELNYTMELYEMINEAFSGNYSVLEEKKFIQKTEHKN